MDRIAAARARLDEASAIALKARDAGPPCSDCRYKSLLDTCGNPAYVVQEFSPATGVYSEKSRTPIGDARDDTGLCGPEALLFEPSATIKSAIAGLRKGVSDLAAIIGAVGICAGLLAMLLT